MVYFNPDIKLIKHADTLYSFENIFSEQALTYFESKYRHPHVWQFDQTSGRRLVHMLDTADQVVVTFAEEFKQFLLQQFDQQFERQNAKLFFDTRAYRTWPHADHPGIGLMLQVYLESESFGAPGTAFHLEQIHNVKNIKNHGYLNFNTDAKMHESYYVPDGARRSFAMSLSRIS